MAVTSPTASTLVPGRAYTWDQLGRMFNFKPRYLSVAGGMLPRPALNALILVTWPGGARSFDYDDYWSQGDLIFTGRGEVLRAPRCPRRRSSSDCSSPDRGSLPLASGGPSCYRSSQEARWRARGRGDDGRDRQILRFRLHFQTGGAGASRSATGPRRPAPGTGRSRGSRKDQHRKRRRFDPTRGPAQYRAPVQHATPEETAARREKANAAHHALLVRLQAELAARGWTDLDEIPSAIDLEARKAKRKVLFEAKTVTTTSELSQTRSGLSQLLEYRFFYGDVSDGLCLVTDAPISDRRIRFLENHKIAVAYEDGNGLVECGTLAQRLLS
jgi:hypothetical protein